MIRTSDIEYIFYDIAKDRPRELTPVQHFIFMRWLECVTFKITPMQGEGMGYLVKLADSGKIRREWLIDLPSDLCAEISLYLLYEHIYKTYIQYRFTENQACAILMHGRTDPRTFFSWHQQEELKTFVCGWEDATLAQVFKAYEHTNTGIKYLNAPGTIFVNGYAAYYKEDEENL